jgi:N-acetylglucosamine-6-phosphate deacetylase
LPPGRHENTALGAVEILDSGPLVVAGQRQLLAGAALPITVGIANVMRFAEAELRTAMDLASLHPARLLGLPFGRLAVGAPADLVLFRLPVRAAAAGLEVVATTKAGQVIFGEVASFAA